MEKQTWRIEVLMRGDVQTVAFENMQSAIIAFIEQRNPKIEVLFTHLEPAEPESI